LAVSVSDREARVLRSIIEAHVRSARPVSSSAVVGSRRIPLSSATVRNVMRSLEEKGLIWQPHTSAGRVPTDSGYRLYVDSLVAPAAPPDSVRAAIEGRLEGLRGRDPGIVATRASRIASDVTRELAVSVALSPGSGVLDRIEIVPLGPGRAVAVATTMSGTARSAAIETGSEADAATLAEAARVLNEWLSGVRVTEAERLVRGRLVRARSGVRKVLEAVLECRPRVFRGGRADRVHYEGARHILRHPEFAEDASCLGGILDSEDALAEAILGVDGGGDVTVTIGSENVRREMRRLSLIVGRYRVGDDVGRVAVIGPTRMRYRRTIGLVGCLTSLLDQMLSGRPGAPRGMEDDCA
jgi:heat-inducible transcriptional repressor